jgi:hypothetical protein
MKKLLDTKNIKLIIIPQQSINQLDKDFFFNIKTELVLLLFGFPH